MSTLQLPEDVAHKIVGMLKPKARPFAVMIFHSLGNQKQFFVKIKSESLSADEKEAFGLNKKFSISERPGGEFAMETLGTEHILDDWVHGALSLEFVFRTEADRERWQKRESFEMYRAAVREIA